MFCTYRSSEYFIVFVLFCFNALLITLSFQPQPSLCLFFLLTDFVSIRHHSLKKYCIFLTTECRNSYLFPRSWVLVFCNVIFKRIVVIDIKCVSAQLVVTVTVQL